MIGDIGPFPGEVGTFYVVVTLFFALGSLLILLPARQLIWRLTQARPGPQRIRWSSMASLVLVVSLADWLVWSAVVPPPPPTTAQLEHALDVIGGPPGFQRVGGAESTWSGYDGTASTGELVTWTVNRLKLLGLQLGSFDGGTGVEENGSSATITALCTDVNIAFYLNQPSESSPFEAEIWETSGGQRPACPSQLFSG
jgi:hypothetical protein